MTSVVRIGQDRTVKMLRGQFKVQWWSEEVLSTLLTSLLHNSLTNSSCPPLLVYTPVLQTINSSTKALNTKIRTALELLILWV